ncbi:MAG: MBL fold metallo-hydrolase [Gammaproteobacteria bacterium]|nr:MBL fold metallo-hydrolase [Gammaproteobacteria bacterium]
MVAPIRIRFIGCGDAFGSGGRLQTCLCVESDTHRFLIDCGASALVGLRKFGVDPNAIDTVLVTHMHGDHYAGIPWLALQRAAAGVRRPLGVLGPEGTAGRLPRLGSHLFPSVSPRPDRFNLVVREYVSFRPTTLPLAWPGGLTVTGYPVTHVPATNPHALRIEVEGKVIVFSGDTAWDDNLIEAASGADIFICEAWSLRPRAPVHLDIETLRARRADIDCERIVLTHMGDDVLAALPIEGFEAADDGMVIEV